MVRETKDHKLNYLSYLTPQGLNRYAEHMKKGEQKHGRGNWQKGGYPKKEYLESAMRHLVALWEEKDNEDHAAAVIFNMFGYMHEEWLESNSD